MIEKIPHKPFDGEINGVIIVKAAVKCGDDVYLGWRHAFIMSDLIIEKIVTKEKPMLPEMQGFISQHGQFINREISKVIVLLNGQIKGTHYHVLCSEDLWDMKGNPA